MKRSEAIEKVYKKMNEEYNGLRMSNIEIVANVLFHLEELGMLPPSGKRELEEDGEIYTEYFGNILYYLPPNVFSAWQSEEECSEV